ncbi:hypothetical protein AMAG_18666, partial [Allomyces macrogynus ATCC 38327]
GDFVMLNARNLNADTAGLPVTAKLRPSYIGPFKVIAQHSPVSFQLKLPDRMIANRVHDVFHADHLKQAPLGGAPAEGHDHTDENDTSYSGDEPDDGTGEYDEIALPPDHVTAAPEPASLNENRKSRRLLGQAPEIQKRFNPELCRRC